MDQCRDFSCFDTLKQAKFTLGVFKGLLMKKVGIIGSTGKMGSTLSSLLETDPFFSLKLRLSKKSCFKSSSFEGLDLLFDFSLPQSLSLYLSICETKKIPLVIGTTGFSPFQKTAIEKASKKIPIFYAANFSIGVALLTYFAQKASLFFSEISITEKHHLHKKDIPSGTALHLQKEISSVSSSTPAILSFRQESLFGEHTLLFQSSQESISFHHTALNRTVFAEGAIKAAQFLLQQKPGLYSMKNLVKI